MNSASLVSPRTGAGGSEYRIENGNESSSLNSVRGRKSPTSEDRVLSAIKWIAIGALSTLVISALASVGAPITFTATIMGGVLGGAVWFTLYLLEGKP